MTEYWLTKWLDSEGIADLEVVRGVLRTKAGFDRLVEAARLDGKSELQELPKSGKAIVAGAGLDLSGFLSCSRAECLKRSVDDLILRSWHYFDKVIVCGLDPYDFLDGLRDNGKPFTIDHVLDHVETALYVRDIGAEEILAFRRKPNICTKHLAQHASEAGLPPIQTLAKELTKELLQGSSLEFVETRRGLEYGFKHPTLDYVSTGLLRNRKQKKSFKQTMSRAEAERLIAALTRDVILSREAGAALGQTAHMNSRLIELRETDGGATVSDVAFNVRLPVIVGARPADLLQLRRDEEGEFEVFRSALGKAIEERLKALPNEDARKVGEAVVSDVVQPVLAGIETRMKRSAGLLAKRSGLVLATGGVVTTIGLLAFAPLTVPGLVLAAGGLVANYNDYLKDRRDIDISDMHFLWRTSSSRHAGGS